MPVNTEQNLLPGDEEIIASRVAAQYEKKHSIFNDVTIGEEVYQFEPREISFVSSPLYRFSIVMPKAIRPLEKEYIKIKYPSENRPEVILSNDDTALNFTFRYAVGDFPDLKKRLSEYKALFKHLNPANVFFSENIKKSGLTVACFDLCSRALDDDIYYFYFFTDLPAKPQAEMLGTFSCPFDLREKWEPLFWQMIETIKPVSG
jgi:hypothetical protein